jgi:hypothetical protein
MKKVLIIHSLFQVLFCSVLFAGEADVIDVKVKKISDQLYDFNVTVSHKDTGWEHYADKWEIINSEGAVLGARILHHPHVNEQPFTRSLSGVKIPLDIKAVIIRAHDSVHGYGGKVVKIDLPQ